MSVCIDRWTDCWGHGSKKDAHCDFCGEPLCYSFLCWDTHSPDSNELDHILLCSRCCCKIKKGLIADLIQLQAATELQRLYPDLTLVREHLRRRDERQQRQEEEGNKILRQIRSER
jgi:hypothetical protein